MVSLSLALEFSKRTCHIQILYSWLSHLFGIIFPPFVTSVYQKNDAALSLEVL
jgi:hypothetical protein